MENSNLAEYAKQLAAEEGSTIPLVAVDKFTTAKDIERFWNEYVEAIVVTGNVSDGQTRSSEQARDIAKQNIEGVIGRCDEDVRVLWEKEFNRAA